MFEHILVPLDGSGLAEAAIPPAVMLSRRLGSQVTLLHIIEKNAPQEIHGQKHLIREDEAQGYLQRIAESKFDPNNKVVTHVHSEEVSQLARSIVDHSQEFRPDLIILCAHGSGGIHDFVVGSIPQQVIAAGSVPVLLLRPDIGNEYDAMKFERFLVALDGKAHHESGLDLASKLAAEIGSDLHLIRIVPTFSTLKAEDSASGNLLPGTTNALLDIAEEQACDYLTEKLQALEANGVMATAEVGRGDPATEVVRAADEQKVDMIILGTHGKKGMGALWAGSVAPQIVSRTHLPVLLVPATG